MMSPLSLCTICLLLGLGMAAYDIDPPKYDLPPPPQIIVNKRLVQAEVLFDKDVLKGLAVQTLVRHRGVMYAAALDGWVYVIRNRRIRPLASISADKKCVVGKVVDLIACGQPTGMVMGPKGNLYIADSFIGVITINIVTGARKLIFRMGEIVNGVPTKFFEDIAVNRNGDMYVAEGSTQWSQAELATLLLESGRHGRVIKMKLKKNGMATATGVVMDGIAYCTSVLLMRDRKSILVSELLRARIIRHYIKGPKKGQTVTFADNLPGFPDNIRHSGRGGFWAACPLVRDQHIFDVIDTLPKFRSIMREQLTDDQLLALNQNRGMILELSASGKIRETWLDLAAEKVGLITEVNDDGRFVHIGAFSTPGISRLFCPRGEYWEHGVHYF